MSNTSEICSIYGNFEHFASATGHIDLGWNQCCILIKPIQVSCSSFLQLTNYKWYNKAWWLDCSHQCFLMHGGMNTYRHFSCIFKHKIWWMFKLAQTIQISSKHLKESCTEKCNMSKYLFNTYLRRKTRFIFQFLCRNLLTVPYKDCLTF